jgi:glutathione peroxidase
MGRLASTIAFLGMLAQPSMVLAQQTVPTGQKLVRSAFDFAFVAIDGTPMPLDAYRGKALLIVNTASFCGYTNQYGGLQTLHEAFASKGLIVIGVPSNDFGAQEPKSNGEIATFCQGAFNVTFPLAEKQVVKGADAHPFYRFARDTLGDAAAPRWNFHKYLIGRDGRLLGGFSAQTAPDAPDFRTAIDRALAGS